METKKKTIWNKKKFSNDDSEMLDPKFQTINMIQKIKRAKKPKGNSRLNLENYTNIEPLQNIYDPITINEEASKMEGFTDDDYDGIEKPFSNDRPDDPKGALLHFIDSIFNTIDNFNHSKAKLIADIFSHKTSTTQDVKLLQKYIGCFEVIGISYFVAYNWFFFLFYDVNYDPTEKSPPDASKKKEKPVQPIFGKKEVSEASKKYPIIDFWLWFGEYVIIFTEFFQWIMLTIVPFFFSMFNFKTCFIFLFFFFIYLFLNFLPTLRNLLADSLNMNTGNIIVVLMLVMFLVLFIPSPWFPTKSDSALDQEAAAATQRFVTTAWYTLIPFILYRFVRAFIVIVLTVPLGAIGLALYTVFYSFFGVVSYYYFNIFKAFEIFNNMYVYIKDGGFIYFTEEQKENFNFIQKFGIIINNFFESLHRYIFFIVYLIMLLVAAVDYFNLIQAPLLKTNLLIISFILCIICLSMIISSFINHANNDENA